MVFCQSCGARNTEDSQFCNMCGAKIARSGEPGGPVGGAPREPSPKTAPLAPFGTTTASGSSTGTSDTMSGSSVSLSAIGVRSPARTYGMLIAAGVVLFALGAIGMWLMMRPGEELVAATGATEGDGEGEDGPIEIGDPVPEGEEAPPEIDFVPGTPRPVTRPTKQASTTGGSGGRATAGGGGTEATSGSTSGSTGGTTGGTTSGSTGGTTSGSTGGSSSGSSGGSSSGSTGGTTGVQTDPDPTPDSPTTGGSAPVDWDRAGGGVVDERSEEDVLMDAYTAHVRRYIREYYVRRAQACFDHETRVDQSTVRGTVLIGFTILGSGEVRNASVDRNTTGRDALGSCLQRQVAGWRLPRPPEGIDELALQMPFSR